MLPFGSQSVCVWCCEQGWHEQQQCNLHHAFCFLLVKCEPLSSISAPRGSCVWSRNKILRWQILVAQLYKAFFVFLFFSFHILFSSFLLLFPSFFPFSPLTFSVFSGQQTSSHNHKGSPVIFPALVALGSTGPWNCCTSILGFGDQISHKGLMQHRILIVELLFAGDLVYCYPMLLSSWRRPVIHEQHVCYSEQFADRKDGTVFKKGGTEIGKAMAEKSKGLFSADDWQCKRFVS